MALFRVAGLGQQLTKALANTKHNLFSIPKKLPFPKKEKSLILEWTLAGGAVITTKFIFDFRIAACDSQIPSKPVLIVENELLAKESPFPWLQFLTYLWPHIIALTVAICSAFAVAILNTKIGVGIGSIVNVVSANLPQTSSSGDGSFIQQIKEPAIKVVKLYLSHAVMTFSYIYSLALVGRFF